MTFQKILDDYDIIIPNGKYILEYFIQSENYQHCHIDIVPLSIDYERYRQVEVFYREITNNSRAKKQYMDFENRFKKTLTKLWLCSDTFVSIDAMYLDAKRIKRNVEKPYKKHISSILQSYKSQKMNIVEEKEIMECYSVIGL